MVARTRKSIERRDDGVDESTVDNGMFDVDRAREEHAGLWGQVGSRGQVRSGHSFHWLV